KGDRDEGPDSAEEDGENMCCDALEVWMGGELLADLA
ncbi:hypothetical protein A2U01_0087443, partial [Trifolium medium]|nr:hypothetical protein [Trifolium medium]